MMVAVMLGTMTLTGIHEAALRPLWFDEVFTAILATKPLLTDVLTALRDGVDTSGPLYYVLLRAIGPVADDPHVALRLPSLLATTGTAWAVYAFARRDLSPAASFVAVAAIVVSQLYHGYSVEARPYALLALGSSLTMLAWQRSDRAPWAAVLLLSAPASVAIHYYAVFALAPLAVAEIVRTATSRRWRWTVWASLVASGAVLAVSWPQLQALKAYYGEHYWSPPSIGRALSTYDTLTGVGVPGVGLGLALALAGCLLVPLLRLPADTVPATPEPAVLVLVLGMIGLPVIVVVSTWVSGGGFAERYALPVVVGLALAASYVTARAVDPCHHAALAASLFAVIAARELAFWGDGARSGAFRQGPSMRGYDELIAEASAAGSPLVVANGLDLLPLVYYHPDAAGSIVGLADEATALRMTGTNSIERDLAIIRRHHPLRIEAAGAFVDAVPRFHLLTRPGPFNWTTPWLVERGYRLTLVQSTGAFTLYAVRAGGS